MRTAGIDREHLSGSLFACTQVMHPSRTACSAMLSHLQEAFDGEVDVRTERAVCRLLLGDMDGAEAVLGLSAASNGSTGPDPGILAYVQVCCPHIWGIFWCGQDGIAYQGPQHRLTLLGQTSCFGFTNYSLYWEDTRVHGIRVGDPTRVVDSMVGSCP
jgi:hypothetical protein